MIANKQKRLAQLGADKLADALLELADYSEEADSVVTRLLASPRQNASNFRTGLANLVKREHFISSDQSSAFARELINLLKALESSECDPKSGVQAVVAFYEADAEIVEYTDDSNGTVGDVFCYNAADLFVSFASRCEEKDWLLALVIELNQHNEYWVRQTLIERIPEFLPRAYSLEAVERLQLLADTAKDEFNRNKWLMVLALLAKALKDPQLLERTHRERSNGSVSIDAQMEIIELLFECRKFDDVLLRCAKISDSSYHSVRRDKILLQIYDQQGNSEKHAEQAWKIFRSQRSVESLDSLIKAVGADQRECIIKDESKKILKGRGFDADDALFLLQVDQIDSAEKYVVAHANKLSGVFYWHLLEISKPLLKHGKILAATLIYRALLTAILERGKSPAYHHGLDYLYALDKWAATIDDWKEFPSHEDYVADLRETHKRKRGFWSNYEPKAVSSKKRKLKSRD